MLEIRHLSVSTVDPEKVAKTLAELTGGKAEPFVSKNMPGAWVCVWNQEKNQLIEFLPNQFLMHATSYGADFKKMEQPQNYNSTHFQLEVLTPLSEIKKIAESAGLSHKFRPYRGGPLYEVWLEDQLLVEFVSDEIRSLLKVYEAHQRSHEIL